MPSLTTNPIPGFFVEYCSVVPKSNPAHPIAVGITPGDAWANGKIALSLDSSQLRVGYDIIRISEEQCGRRRKGSFWHTEMIGRTYLEQGTPGTPPSLWIQRQQEE
jgi:hypothetical protein